MNSLGEMQLGGNITLVGFRDIDASRMIVIKKMVGNYIKKVQERDVGFENVSVDLKKIHNSEFEINCKLMLNGKIYSSSAFGFNLFIVLNDVMSKVLKEAKVI